MFFGYEVQDIDPTEIQTNKEDLELEFYDVLQACEKISDQEVKKLDEVKFDQILE